jgi:ketosteroid isomerase-like protein
MSRETVEIVRRGYEAYAQGDLDTVLDDIDPEMITYRADPDGAIFKGSEGFLAAIAEWVEDFDDFTITPAEFIDANDSQVVVRVHQSAVGKQSGAPIEADFWFVHTLSGDKVTRLDMFVSKSQALEAAGLRAQIQLNPEASVRIASTRQAGMLNRSSQLRNGAILEHSALSGWASRSATAGAPSRPALCTGGKAGGRS